MTVNPPSSLFLIKRENNKVEVAIKGYLEGEQHAMGIIISLEQFMQQVDNMNQQEVIPVSNPEWYKD